MGKAFDESKDDSTFYLPPEVFDNPEFKRGLKMFLSPDGNAARMIITHDGDPATRKAFRISTRSDRPRRKRSREPRWPVRHLHRRHRVGLQGQPATWPSRPVHRRIAAISLILLIMMFVTRSVVAALVIVGTVVLSLGASFGLRC